MRWPSNDTLLALMGYDKDDNGIYYRVLADDWYDLKVLDMDFVWSQKYFSTYSIFDIPEINCE